MLNTMSKIRALIDERAILVAELNEISAERKRLHERLLEKMDALAKLEAELKQAAAERSPA